METILNLPEVLQLNKLYKKDGIIKTRDFDILKEIGSGSFGKVFLVTDIKTKKNYALKALSKNQIARLKIWDQLSNEIKILAKCNHPNIIKLFSVFEDSSRVFLLLELAKGGSLFDKLKKKKKFSEQETAKYTTDVLRALHYLHSMNPPILHRDIKPENILFHEGKIKMADFGWSNLEDDFRNTYCGTPDYLSPEMIKGTGHNEKLDIWTVGILMFELLHGMPPFRPKKKIKDKRAFQRKIEYNVLNGKIEFDESLSKEVEEVIRGLISCKPQKRPSAAETFEFAFFKKFNCTLVNFSQEFKKSKSKSKSKSHLKRKYEEKMVKLKLQRDNYKCKFELGEKVLEKEKEKRKNLRKEFKEIVS